MIAGVLLAAAVVFIVWFITRPYLPARRVDDDRQEGDS